MWPKTGEQETIIYGNQKFFDKFCPEISYERFGYFASYLGRYADELDHDLAHKKLGEISIIGDVRAEIALAKHVLHERPLLF